MLLIDYDLSSSDETVRLISHVRLELGDTVEDDGVLPDGGNLLSSEIEFMLGQHDNDVDATVGALSAILARRWASAVDVTVGPRRESLSQAAKRWQELAAASSAGTDGDQPASGSFAMQASRADDGYTENAAGGEYSRG